ncbi:MAG TPA: septum formation initiator family protein [Nitrospirales bacterium]|jgi:cell division protein FtsB|nr:septum formation initiator family protein [Nitrospirales bacterium]
MRARLNQRRTTLQAKRKRRWTFYVVGGFFLMSYFTYEFLFDTMGFMKYLNMKRTHGQIAEEIKTIEEENTRLRKDIEAVKHDPATLEGLARDRLGMVKQGETVFLIAPSRQNEYPRQSGSPAERP